MITTIMRSVLLFGLGVLTCLVLLWLPETFDKNREDAVGIQQGDMLAAGHANTRTDTAAYTDTRNKQIDIVHVRRLAAVSFERPLVVITVPQQATQSAIPVSKHNMPIVAVPSADSANMPNQATLDAPLTDETVSADLLAKFNRAMAETSDAENIPVAETTETYNAVPIAELPERLRTQVPNISYNSHVYSSKPENRSVRLNNRDLREGSWLSENVEVLEIMQNEVIMRVGPQSFSLKALADWSK
jgi:general secretion pathway protein B